MRWILLAAWPLLAACPGKLDDPCFELACDAPTQVFQPTCEASICHRAGPFPATAGGLDLESPGLEARIRNRTSECPGFMIFDPAHPEQSSLFLKTGTDPPCKERMPYAGTALSDNDRLCLLSWLKWQACQSPP